MLFLLFLSQVADIVATAYEDYEYNLGYEQYLEESLGRYGF